MMTEPARLAGKRALVTGGSRGIGAAIARRLAADGAAVAVNYVADQSSADKLVTELTGKGHQVAAFRADVSDRAQTHDLVQRMVAEFGGLDILASNAGVVSVRWDPSPKPTSTGSFTSMSPGSSLSPRPRLRQ